MLIVYNFTAQKSLLIIKNRRKIMNNSAFQINSFIDETNSQGLRLRRPTLHDLQDMMVTSVS